MPWILLLSSIIFHIKLLSTFGDQCGRLEIHISIPTHLHIGWDTFANEEILSILSNRPFLGLLPLDFTNMTSKYIQKCEKLPSSPYSFLYLLSKFFNYIFTCLIERIFFKSDLWKGQKGDMVFFLVNRKECKMIIEVDIWVH